MELSIRIDELVLDGVEPGDPRVAREVEQAVARAEVPKGVDTAAVSAAVVRELEARSR